MGDVVRLAVKNAHPQGRACQTCRYKDSWGQCGMFSLTTTSARIFRDYCGPEGKAWEPRLGLIERMRRYLFGEG